MENLQHLHTTALKLQDSKCFDKFLQFFSFNMTLRIGEEYITVDICFTNLTDVIANFLFLKLFLLGIGLYKIMVFVRKIY